MTIETLAAAVFFAALFLLTAKSRAIYITRVIDGDTVQGLWRGKLVTIRLYGIDAPELDQNGGQRSRAELERLCLGRWCTMRDIQRDKYGRIVADIGVNGEMVRSGWAFAYMSRRFADLERSARGLGVHRLRIVKPWEWRKKNRPK